MHAALRWCAGLTGVKLFKNQLRCPGAGAYYLPHASKSRGNPVKSKTLASAITAAIATLLAFGAHAQQPAPRAIKMQSTWPASNTLQEHFKTFAERVDKLTQGSIKI